MLLIFTHLQKYMWDVAGGSIWRPPPMNPYTQGMPEDMVEPDLEPRKGSLSPTQRDRLEDLIRNMTPERLKVAEVMVFCVEHSEAADEICDCIVESLSNPTTGLSKKVTILIIIFNHYLLPKLLVLLIDIVLIKLSISWS